MELVVLKVLGIYKSERERERTVTREAMTSLMRSRSESTFSPSSHYLPIFSLKLWFTKFNVTQHKNKINPLHHHKLVLGRDKRKYNMHVSPVFHKFSQAPCTI